MKKIKTFILGTAAAMVAATGVQAADPIFDIKDPREPVYRCDITGFIELPGTDICFKVGGFALLTVTAWDSKWVNRFTVGGIVPHGIIPGAVDPFFGVATWHSGQLGDSTNFYGLGRVNFDARTATEYGTVRAFIEIQAADNKTRGGGAMGLRHAFVQFGNWTFGKAWSTFLHLASSAPATDPYVVVGDNFIRRNMIRYTQPVGNGVTVSVALEDQGYNNPSPAVAFPTFAQSLAGAPVIPILAPIPDRRQIPDLVANINVAGAWGSAQLSGALHKNEVRTAVGWNPLLPNPFQSTDSTWGWAVLFGLNLNVPTTEGSNLGFKAVYTDGASQYMQDLHAGNLNTVWGNQNPLAVNDSIIDTVTQWSLMGWYQHYWTPTVNTSIGVGYAETDYGNSAPTVGWAEPLWTGFNTGLALPANKVKQLQVFANVEWTPVANTSFILEGHWGRVDYGDYGGWKSNFIDPIYAGLGIQSLAKSREDAFAVTFQARRSF